MSTTPAPGRPGQPPGAPNARGHRLAAAGLGALVALAHFGALLLPERLLVVRDLTFLHLPLREAFARLFAEGWPAWNPAIHAGQPVLSNPHYAAFYPLTWLGLAIGPRLALHGEVLLHAGWAFAGAWFLARTLGATRGTAALAAVGFAGSAYFVTLTHTLLIFFGMSWMPWVLALAARGQALVDSDAMPGWAQRVRRSAPAGFAWGLQMLSGDPASVMVTGLLLALLGLDRVALADGGDRAVAPRAGRLRPATLAIIALLAAGVAAVQVVPTSARLLESARGSGLDFAEATAWSTRPARLIEAVFPTFHGDGARDEENLFFGWTLHDKLYPFLLSISPGLLLLVLGLRGLLRRDLPWAWPLRAAALLGVALALGRHNPLFAAFFGLVPGASWFRYPEKYLLLALVAIWLAGVLEWQRGRGETPPRASDRGARALALAVVVGAAGRLAWLFAAPAAAGTWMARGAGVALSPAVESAGLAYLRQEGWLSLALAAATLAVVWFRRSPRAIVAAVALVAAEGWIYAHRANPTLPISDFAAPPAVALTSPEGRLFHDVAFYRGPQVGLRVGRLGFYQIKARLDRLEPYAGILWGLRYALHEDYDLMLTRWGRHALELLHRSWDEPVLRDRLLAAWHVTTRASVRWPQEMREAMRRDKAAPSPVRIDRLEALARVRVPAEVRFHPDPASAVAASRAEAFDVALREHLVGAAPADWPLASGGAAILAVEESTNRLRLAIDAPADAVAVVADTFDAGWEARADGAPTPTLPTALGQTAILVPAGTRAVDLVYRDPSVAAGGSLTLVTLLGIALATSRARRAGPDGDRDGDAALPRSASAA